MPNALQRLIAEQVRGVFNDRTRGERPVQRRTDGLFGPESVAWRVHGDVTTMMVGGVAALLLQMLHPAVLAGVWDHSNFRRDMHGRLRRTARFIALTTYGGREEAEAAIDRVREIHRRVQGVTPDGSPYAADDPELIAWVHATETLSFLDAWKAFAEPAMRVSDQDRYFAEMAVIAERLGAASVPRSRVEMLRYVQVMRPHLRSDRRTREIADIVLQRPILSAHALPFGLVQRAAVDQLPRWARRMHGLQSSGPARPLVAAGTLAMARTLRWAFG
jgi:uncharacterized protein (DUF2236 family)